MERLDNLMHYSTDNCTAVLTIVLLTLNRPYPPSSPLSSHLTQGPVWMPMRIITGVPSCGMRTCGWMRWVEAVVSNCMGRCSINRRKGILE